MRKGISMTMTLIVAALVILAAGLTVITVGQASFGKVKSLIIGSGDTQKIRMIKNRCLSQKSRICQGKAVDWYIAQRNGEENALRQWAKTAQYNGKSCWTHAEQRQVFGAQGIEAIPKCQTQTLRQFKTCGRRVVNYCDQNVLYNSDNADGTCARKPPTVSCGDCGGINNCQSDTLRNVDSCTTSEDVSSPCGKFSFSHPEEYANAFGEALPSRCNQFTRQFEQMWGRKCSATASSW
ncbi:MAG: hypothetical protein SVU32_07725 [Candidatus Nanohaloarchaea archaeon]|nr:hypothetical protein [Candidatus Nanohaloarchaea archaeon]